MANWVGSLLFVLAIALAIGLHEWGHFVTARWFGMRAERFFLGFGPTLWSIRRGETEYGIKALPLGGFVRIAGMSIGDARQRPVAEAVFDAEVVAADRRQILEAEAVPLDRVPATPSPTWRRLADELARRGVPQEDRRWILDETVGRAGPGASPHEVAAIFTSVAAECLPDTGRVGDVRHRVLFGDEGRFFHDRPPWQRAIVLAAGSTMHFVQAIAVLFVALWAYGGQPVPVVNAVVPGSPADTAGLRSGDRIVAVEGYPVDDFEEASSVISAHPGEQIRLAVVGHGGARQVRLTPAVVVGMLEPGSPLAASGLQPQDRIVAVAGKSVERPSDLRATRDRASRVPVSVERVQASGGRVPVEVTVPAQLLHELPEVVRGQAGFHPDRTPLGAMEAAEATMVGESSFPALVKMTFTGIGAVFGPEGLASIPAQLSGGERDPSGGASLVGATMLAGQGMSESGLFFLFVLIASLNVFFGIFNLAPLPPLDGGHLAVLVVERGVNAVRGLRGLEPDYVVDPRTVTAIAVPVIVVLGMVALAFLVLDITNPLRLPQ
ncbi:MAG: site-2 protease family protein [Actinomycetota bacterium]|nr:site-2 protease family protein [Actinomycetota bacterium]